MLRVNDSLVLWLFWGLWMSGTHGQSGGVTSGDIFYLSIREVQDSDNVTREDCRNATENVCFSREEKHLSCMCEDEHEEAELLRERCAANGRNETSVRRLNPDMLGICAPAFAGLGYEVTINKTNPENVSSTYTNGSLAEKINNISEYSSDFRKLLDRTIVGVYLSSDQQRNICKDAYDEWLCSTSLSLYNVTGEEVKPCLGVCTRVVQQCPYYLPSKFQTDDETIYGGYPVFDCPDVSILKYYMENCKDCHVPYHLDDDHCIGRNRSPSIQTPTYHTLLLVLFNILRLL